jgi:hypothetical protein
MLRNPYLLLGIPFGASREEATAAFVRKARPLRRAGTAGSDRLTDLTWALNQIDEKVQRPQESMDIYRIPGCPDALRPSGAGGLLDPGPETLSARPADREAALRELRALAAAEYLESLVRTRASHIDRFAP